MTSPLDSLSTALSGRYTIERELGAGGMATVYLAHDVKHDRRVALKLLRSELAAVIGAARFLNEIKTTANLQHPHILALHDSGEVEGTVFYVMPFVDGESLRDRLNREKQLPVEEAIRIAVEVAGALEYAHTHGVIHRDIKPENILLQGGHALVADFGIALAASKTEGGTRMTETGMSLGTPHYMSPEQAMGEREITAKSDVYALGAVLYEMLTGEPPFTGPTAQAIVARVMTEEPRSLTLQRRTVPRHVEAAVNRALSKLPADRFGNAAAFADALVNPAAVTESVGQTHVVVAAKRPVLAMAAGAALVAVAALAYVLGRMGAAEPEAPLAQFVVTVPDSMFRPTGRCCGVALALSPDGRTLVIVGNNTGDAPLYRRTLGRLEVEAIPGTNGGSMPFFSPDGLWIGFYVDGRLRKVSMSGGPPLPIVAAPGVAEASWGENDVIVYASDRSLWTVPAAGGQPTQLTTPDSGTGHYAPTMLPGGNAALFSMRSAGGALDGVQIGVVDLASRRIDTIGLGTRAMYANGHLVYAGADNTLLVQAFDVRARRTTAPAVAILDGVAVHGNTTHEFTVAPTGALVYQRGGTETGGGDRLRIWSSGGSASIQLPGRAGVNLEEPAFSPDGQRIALSVLGSGAAAGGVSGGLDVWLFDVRQGTLDRFTVGGGRDPVWSPDGREIAFSKPAEGIFVKRSDGTGTERLVLRGSGLFPQAWLPDGTSIVFNGPSGGSTSQTNYDVGVVTLGDSVPRWLVQSEFNEALPQPSRDGRWLAYVSNRTGRQEVYVQPLAGDGPTVPVSTEGGRAPRWSPDGRTLYYVNIAGDSMLSATRASGTDFRIAARNGVTAILAIDLNPYTTNWNLHPDGKQFLYIDLGGAGTGAPLVWVLNWPEMLRAIGTAR